MSQICLQSMPHVLFIRILTTPVGNFARTFERGIAGY
jgi:hypothetical protein